MFPKSPHYDTFGKRSLFCIRDEEEHCQRMQRVSHLFPSSLMPDIEGVMHEEVANLLRAMDARRGAKINMLHWSRMLALDIAGELGMIRTSYLERLWHFLLLAILLNTSHNWG
jgi:cytochrome P450